MGMRYCRHALGLIVGAGLLTGAVAAQSSPQMKQHLDIPYAEMEGVQENLLSLDLYAPTKQGPHPVLVMIHGGGWCIGDKANANVGETKARYFVSEGFVYISINYRLSPAVRHPAHVQDVARALAWIRDRVADYGGGPESMYVMGHSAGAHLAALVATDERYLQAEGKEIGILDGVILLDGAGYDLPKRMGDPDSPIRRKRGMFIKAFGDDPAGWADPSPLFHVAPGKDIPPFLIFHAGIRAAAREQSRAIADALEEADVPVRVVHAPDRTHGSMNTCIGVADDPYTGIVRQFLANPAGPLSPQHNEHR